MNNLDNPLIRQGMAAQLARRRAEIAAGARPLGWKVGLGAPAMMQKLGLHGPLVGYLMQRALLLSGSNVSLAGFSKPVMEAEIAVRMARNLPGGASADEAAAAVKEIMPAIEIADLDPAPTPDNLGAVLEGNVYQRHVMLCGNTRPGASTAGLTSRLIRRGAEVSATNEPELLTGKLADIVAHVANVLTASGETLSAGDIIITGSITPPVMIEPDETEIAHVLDPIGEVSVTLSRD
ncbi:MAG: fumarylacetoacetate hydrolase family protein [Pseudolabrys sp.]|nr:fumarylacetoacetate hydrolase family protein [Pseudolabrys sp.]